MDPLSIISGHDFDYCTCKIGLYEEYGYAYPSDDIMMITCIVIDDDLKQHFS